MELRTTVDITAEDVKSLMHNPMFVAIAKAVLIRDGYPRQWSKETRHPYEKYQDEDGWKCDVPTVLPEDGLEFEICADCDTYVWIKIGDNEIDVSMRSTKYTLVAPHIQVKATRSALLIQRAVPVPVSSHCRYAAD